MKFLAVSLILVAASALTSCSAPADKPSSTDTAGTVPSETPSQGGQDSSPDRRYRLPVQPTLFFSGDSLSEGWHATTEDKGFTAIVSSSIREIRPKARLVGAHKAGSTLQEAIALFPIPPKIDLAVVELGTNDVSKRRKTSPQKFKQEYGEYLRAIVATNPNAGLICIGTFAPASESSDAIDAVIWRACNEHGGSYVDLTSTFEREGMRGPDGRRTWVGPADMGHPNDAGHRRIAALVLSHVHFE